MRTPRGFRERPRVESLEARVLYSADPASAVFDAMAGMPPVERRVIDAPQQQACVATASDGATTEVRHELVLVDTRVSNWQQLVDDIPRGADRNVEVVLLDPARDGLEQVSARLAQEHGLDAVHIVSHGEAGALQIGTTRLDFSTLLADATTVSRWRLALNEGADLLLYGCDLAANEDGRSLVDALARLTGADVAASIDATGNAAQHADWELEYQAGSIETPVVLDAPGQSAWSGVLAITPTSSETLVNGTTTGSQSTHNAARQVAIDANGNFVVVWADTTTGDVMGRLFNANGTAAGAEFRLNTTTANTQDRPVVAMDDAGNFVAVWQSAGQDGSLGGVYAQRFNASGVKQGGEFLVSQVTAGDQLAPTVAMDRATGAFTIAWSSADGGGSLDVVARRFDANGNALGNEFRVNTYTTNEQEHASIALSPSGNFVIAWESYGQDGGADGIYAQRYDANGVAQGSEFLVSTATAPDQFYPTAAIDASGNFVVTWTSVGQDGSGRGIYGQRFDSAGNKLGSEFLVNTTTVNTQEYSVVTTNAFGDFVVTWESYGQDKPNTYGIYAREYDRNGVAMTGETFINTTISGDQSMPSVAWQGGNAVFVWSGNGTGDSSGVYFRQATITGPGVSVTPSAGLTTTEAGGGTASFGVVLTSQPTADVTISFASSDTTEGTVSVPSLTFSASNWNVAQTVTVTGVDDAVDDGDVGYSIVTAAATSADAIYNGASVADVALSNLDNDTAGIGWDPGGPNVTSENGSSTSLNVMLWSQPTADVTIPFYSSDTTEATISVSSLTFTPANWNVAQTITITGVDDAVVDGDIFYGVLPGAAVSSDANYNGYIAPGWGLTNLDNDAVVGIVVSPIGGNTTEAGGTANFSVVLTSQPTANVTISIASNDTTEGTVSTSSLTFTSANWNVTQAVTVTGVNDSLDDGDIAYSIVTGAASSSDAGYNGMAVVDVAVTNVDNDTAGVTVSAVSGNTTEAGGAATFNVVLTSQPTANVTISIASNDTTEGTVSTISLTFAAANWNVAQVITVIGVDDALDDGNIAYSIVTGAAASADTGYNGMAVNDVSVSNVDNDTAGVTVSPVGGSTAEAGGSATFNVVLTSQPTADVTVSIASSDTTEGTVSTSSLTFTAANWDFAQVVSVTGVDDALDDGDIAYSIINGAVASADSGYNGMAVNDVSVTNVDNDTAGVTVSPISGNTTEAGGTATFNVVLTSQPTANVTISIASNDTTEGTVSASSLTFTTANWNVAQVITVTGVDDALDDGNVIYSIVTGAALSTDASYNGMTVSDISATNVDNDTAGITVSPISGNTSEAGGTATFGIVLDSQPTANVTIAITSSDTSEGTASTGSLTFTAANWNVAQTVTVAGVNDAVDDGDIVYGILNGAAVSADGNYSGRNAADVAVTNVDDDTAGIGVSAISGSTTEAGGTASFTVVLTSQPTADVTISITSSATSEGTVSTPTLTFNATNWNTAQTVVVTGVDDAVDDGNTPYSIVLGMISGGDALYNALDPSDIGVTNVDNDSAGITVSPISGSTSEAGGTANFSVVLISQPTADVTISIASNDTTEGTVSVSSLTFTAANWNVAQVVIVTGMEDAVDDGDTPYSIVTGAAVSADGNYNSRNGADVAVTNADDDTAGISVSAISGNTTEAGGTASFTVVLTSQPTAGVTIAIASNDTTEGTVSVSSVTFTAANWNIARIVTVTGVDDPDDDGNVVYGVTTGAATSTDLKYAGLDAGDVVMTNVDDDTVAVIVSPISVSTTEAGGTATFTIVLASQPTDDVTVALAASNPTEGALSLPSVVFTAANWNIAQTITVTGVDDAVDDGDVPFAVVTGPVTSNDGTYSGVIVGDVAVTNLDDDAAGITVSPIGGSTSEAGAIASFSVVLTSQPTADVTISITSSATSEGTVSTPTLTFNATNWNTAQTVVVTGVNDNVDDGDTPYTIVLGMISSGDALYNALDPADVGAINVDDDSAGITVSPISGNTTEAGGAASFSVVLTSRPTASVTISVASGNTAEGTVSTSSLTFTVSNWNVAQVVTVTGVDDAVDDGDVAYTIVTGTAVSADVGYNGMDPSDLSIVNADDDTAAITVSPASGNTIEAGGAAIFNVVLTSQPTSNVTVSLASSDPTEGTVSTSSLTFTAANWNVAQTVTVTGVDDALDDGDVAYSILTSAATSIDPGYSGMAAADVVLTNVDNESAPVLVLPGSLQVNEDAPLRLGDTGLGIADANGDLTRVDLSVAHGGLEVDLTGGAHIVAASADNRSISLAGTQAQLVDALARTIYRCDADWFGTDTLGISATDATGLRDSNSVTVQVMPLNDAPVITSASHVEIPEGQVSVIDVTSTDVEADTPHYAIVGGADAAQFVIDTQSGELRLRQAPDAKAPIDSDHDNVYEVTVEADDARGGTARQNLGVSVQAILGPGEPAPAYRSVIDTAIPDPTVAPVPTVAAKAEPALPPSAPSVADSSRVLPAEPSSQIDGSSGTVRVADSPPGKFVLQLLTAAARGGDENEISWHSEDLRRALLLSLGYDTDSSAAREKEESQRPRVSLPTNQETDAVDIELGTVVLQTLGIALTAGSVWWALRAAGLVTALLASVPAWRQLDFLPVLADDEDDDAPKWAPAEDAEAARDEEAVGRDLFVEGVLR